MNRWLLIVVSCVVLNGLSSLAQDQPADTTVAPNKESDAAKRSRDELQVCLDHVASMKLQYAETGAVIERVPNPVLRFGAPIFGNHHGALWVWGRRGRPVAVLEMCQQMKDGFWHHGSHCTTDASIKLTMPTGQVWTPKSNSVTFKPLPGAPIPAETPAARMRQMKAFAQKITAHELWTWPTGDGSRHELRMLPTPVHRYEDAEQQLVDGALFIIAQGTNPEATLFFEAVQRTDEEKPIWQFAVGQSSLAEIVVNFADEEIHHGKPVNDAEAGITTSTYWRLLTKIEESKEPRGK